MASTPRAEAIFIFITDILWLSERLLFVSCESPILNAFISLGVLVFVSFSVVLPSPST
jgi:hypothetical protein